LISNISTNLAIGPWTRNILAFAVPAGTSRSALAAYSPFSNIACLTCGTSFDGNGEYTRIRRVKFLDLRRKKDRTTGTAWSSDAAGSALTARAATDSSVGAGAAA
jgi:hypothetical protein